MKTLVEDSSCESVGSQSQKLSGQSRLQLVLISFLLGALLRRASDSAYCLELWHLEWSNCMCSPYIEMFELLFPLYSLKISTVGSVLFLLFISGTLLPLLKNCRLPQEPSNSFLSFRFKSPLSKFSGELPESCPQCY